MQMRDENTSCTSHCVGQCVPACTSCGHCVANIDRVQMRPTRQDMLSWLASQTEPPAVN